jgi:hypothetical protein
MKHPFRDKSITVTLTGEQWFTVYLALTERGAMLSPEGQEIFALANKILRQQVFGDPNHKDLDLWHQIPVVETPR